MSIIAPVMWAEGQIIDFEDVNSCICGSQKVGMLERVVEGRFGVGRRGNSIDRGLLFAGVAEDGHFIRAHMVNDPSLVL